MDGLSPSRARGAEKDTGPFYHGRWVAFTLLGQERGQALPTSAQRSLAPPVQALGSRITHPFLEHPTLRKDGANG